MFILIWVHADEITARERLIARGLARDAYKLANWDKYITQVKHEAPSNINGLIVINNTNDSQGILKDQIAKLLKTIILTTKKY